MQPVTTPAITYEGGRPSTRAKDLIDLALIAATSTLDATLLRAAIDTTFTRRNTQRLPTTLPEPPTDWTAQYKRLAQEVGAPADLGAGHADASAVLTPILSSEIASGTWSPIQRLWVRDGSES